MGHQWSSKCLDWADKWANNGPYRAQYEIRKILAIVGRSRLHQSPYPFFFPFLRAKLSLMASTSFTSALCFFSQNPIRNLQFSSPISSSSSSGVAFSSISTARTSCSSLSPSNSRFSSRFTRNCSSSTAPVRTLDYEVLPLLQNDRIVNCMWLWLLLFRWISL